MRKLRKWRIKLNFFILDGDAEIIITSYKKVVLILSTDTDDNNLLESILIRHLFFVKKEYKNQNFFYHSLNEIGVLLEMLPNASRKWKLDIYSK